MKILITGGCGFIGSNFIRYKISNDSGCKIVNIDKLTYAGNLRNLDDIKDDPRYKFVHGDIFNRDLIIELFSKEKFDAVINFAAESHVDRSILDSSPFIETNIKGVHVLLETARKYPVWRFIQISTDEVYGSAYGEIKFTEESRLLPNSPYAASKASADFLCRSYYKAYRIPILITRSSNNYGPYQFPEKLIPLTIRNAILEKKIPIYGKGEQIRDWLYVEDNCRGIDIVLLKGEEGEIYNIAGGQEKRNIDVAKTICRFLATEIGKNIKDLEKLITYIADPRGDAHDFRYAVEWNRIKNDLGWYPKVDFDEGIKLTILWYLEHQDWVQSIITGEYLEYYEKLYGKTCIS